MDVLRAGLWPVVGARAKQTSGLMLSVAVCGQLGASRNKVDMEVSQKEGGRARI